MVGAPGEIFPNTALLSRQPRTMAAWHPRGPHQTECWRWFFVDRDAPKEVKSFLRDYYIRYSGPAGMTEQDDMENWDYATQASRGVVARRYPYNYQQGLGEELPSTLDRAVHSHHAIAGEVNARAFYRRWSEFVDNLSWPELNKLAQVDERATVRTQD